MFRLKGVGMKAKRFLPATDEVAINNLTAALRRGPENLNKTEFLSAYFSMAFLYPGFHPDSMEDWTKTGFGYETRSGTARGARRNQ